jgi:hypothetical protein
VAWHLPSTPTGLTATGSWSYGGASLGTSGAGARFGAALDE